MRLAIVVEGRTEEEFVKGLIAPELQRLGITPQPILLDGNVSTHRVAAEMARLYWDFDSVSSFVDYYGFKDKKNESPEALQGVIDGQVRKLIRQKHNKSRIFSYVQKHEFEGLLFSDTEAFDRLYGETKQFGKTLENIRSQFDTPEDINDNLQTAPSKRIAAIIRGYQKVIDGALVAMEIDLSTIRVECPCFDAWVSRLEALGPTD